MQSCVEYIWDVMADVLPRMADKTGRGRETGRKVVDRERVTMREEGGKKDRE